MSSECRRTPEEKSRKGRPRGGGQGSVAREIAGKLGVSERHAYRLAAMGTADRPDRKAHQALLARYALLERADPTQAAALNQFLDETIHALLTHTELDKASSIDSRWGKSIGVKAAEMLAQAIDRREKRLNDAEDPFG